MGLSLNTQIRPPLVWAGVALGFGLGGFFDGILLHQILQWHHLLSGIEQAGRDIRFLILTDGLFHGLMYVVTTVGIWLLWKYRRLCQETGCGRHLLAAAIAGFGAWHIIDGVLSHWILGIHRVRMDVGNPLIWDLAWFSAFGIVPLCIAWILHTWQPGPNRFQSSPAALVIAVVLAAPVASLPPPSNSTVIVYFHASMSAADKLSALDEVDGRIIWTDPSSQVWAVDLPPQANPFRLYKKGALFVSNSLLPTGCVNWINAEA